MDAPCKPEPPRHATASALRVFCDRGLLRAITSFQGGLSMALREIWIAHDTTPPPVHITPTLLGRFLKRAINVITPYHLKLIHASRIYVKGRWRVPSISRAVRTFVDYRRVDLLEWMVANGVRFPHAKPGSLWTVPIETSHFVILEILRVHCPLTLAQAQRILPDLMTTNANVALLEWLGANIPGLQLPVHFTHKLAIDGKLDALRTVLERQLVKRCHEDTFLGACYGGHCDVLDYLLQRGDHPSLPMSVDKAAEWKGLHALVFLHERGIATATTRAMDYAAYVQRWDVVQFLHTHRTEGGTASAANAAAEVGNLTCLKLLLETHPDRCTTTAMNCAAAHGSIEMLQFLHEHSNAGCTKFAMDTAAARGHLNVVQFLHEHRSEGCTTIALDKAALGGHVETVRYLCEHRSEGCTIDGIKEALKNHRVNAVQVLYTTFPHLFVGAELLTDVLLYGAFDVYLDMRKAYLDKEDDLARRVMVRAFHQHELRTIGFILNELGRSDLIECIRDEAAKLSGKGSHMWREAVERLIGPASEFVESSLHPFLLDRRTPTWAVDAVVNESRPLKSWASWAEHAMERRDPLLLEVLRDVPSGTLETDSSDGNSFGFAGARARAIRVGERSVLEWLLTNIDDPIEPTLLGEALYYHRYDTAEWLVTNYPAACAEVNWAKVKRDWWYFACGEFGLRDGLLLDWLETHEVVRSAVSFRGVIDYAAWRNDVASLKRLYSWYPELLTPRPALVELANLRECPDTKKFLFEIGWSPDCF